jgi:hypothetical protein
MAAALLTLTALSIAGIAASFVLAFVSSGAETATHVLVGVFATILNLLAHSLMMFYLIGKGRAVKDAMAEAGVEGDFYARASRVRAPVFGQATIAMALTMVTGIIGASVDVRVLPAWPHALLALAAVGWQFKAFYIEARALSRIGGIVDEVNRTIFGS